LERIGGERRMRPIAVDLHTLKEDERIQAIGNAAMTGQVVGVIIEKKLPQKIARYKAKLLERFPSVELVSETDGPTKATVTLRFGKRATNG
jgi:hypothetical protein